MPSRNTAVGESEEFEVIRAIEDRCRFVVDEFANTQDGQIVLVINLSTEPSTAAIVPHRPVGTVDFRLHSYPNIYSFGK